MALVVLAERAEAQLTPPPPAVEGANDEVTRRIEKLERQNELLMRQIELLKPHAGESDVSTEAADGKTPPAKKDAAKDSASGKEAEKVFEVGKQLEFKGMWRNGVYFETADKAFKYQVGGTIQFDMGWFSAPYDVKNSIGVMNNYTNPGAALSDGMDFRRARLRFAGTAYETVEFFAQYEFANSIDLRRRTIGVTEPTKPSIYDSQPGEAVLFNEVFVGLTQIPVLGAVRAGHHREALNFITGTADRNQVWLERGLLFDAFNGDYNFASGITIDRTYFNDRAYSWLGFFENNSRNFSQVGDGNYAYDVRLCALPIWQEEENETWVHVGIDYSYRNLTQNQIRFRARPMVRVGTGFQVPSIVDTGTMFSRDGQQILNFEFASAVGPWTFAAEACRSWVPNVFTGSLPNANGTLPKGAAAVGNYYAEGMYVELLRFITPDHRQYRKERPGYDRVAPRENFFFVDSDNGPIWNRGAWEVGVRYDYLDLTNAGVNGGTAQAVTAAVNWYLNPNTRVQLNYFVMTRHFDAPETAPRINGAFSGLGIRFNMDF
jgi:phosphate-selective porin OprO/OprP